MNSTQRLNRPSVTAAATPWVGRWRNGAHQSASADPPPDGAFGFQDHRDLTRPGQIDRASFGVVKNHCETGFEITRDVEFPWPIAEIIRQHHERLDGSGYPRGLKGDEIILEARIIAVADVVEAMHSQRPYRESLGPASALEEIRKNAGLLYDPRVVAACIDLIEGGEFAFDGPSSQPYEVN